MTHLHLMLPFILLSFTISGRFASSTGRGHCMELLAVVNVSFIHEAENSNTSAGKLILRFNNAYPLDNLTLGEVTSYKSDFARSAEMMLPILISLALPE